ncbi:hypothetical protein Tco_0275795 [Tanacetum coccineum]
MSNLKFADIHNMVAFLSKPTECEGFEQIINFLNAHTIKYARTVNPIIYVSCIELFWATGIVKKVNGETQIHALVDGKKVVVTEATVRRDLQLADEEGVDYLPNSTIFKELTRMGYKKVSQKLTFYKAFFSHQWKFLIHTVLQCLGAKITTLNKFSSTMASAIICLATNQKFNFSKFFFEGMLRNLDNKAGKILMYPRFIQLFVNHQVEGMPTHKRKYDAPYHTKKVFGNMKRVGKDFSGNVTPLFPTMVVQNQAQPSTITQTSTTSTQTPTTLQPTTSIQPSQPQKQQLRKPIRKVTEVPQPSESVHVADKAVNEEIDDSLVRAATTATSLDAEQNRGNINKTRSKATPNEPSSPGTSSGGGPRVLDLEKTKTFQQIRIESLEKKVKKLQRSKKSRSHKLKRLYKVGLTARVESSEEEDLGEDASKQGRISDIDADADITLVSPFVDEQDVEMSEKEEDVALNAAKDGVKVNDYVTVEEITLAQALQKMKSTTPKAKGVVIQEREQEPEKPLKKKDQIRLDEETAKRLQAEFDEEERLANEEAQNVEKANIALTEE